MVPSMITAKKRPLGTLLTTLCTKQNHIMQKGYFLLLLFCHFRKRRTKWMKPHFQIPYSCWWDNTQLYKFGSLARKNLIILEKNTDLLQLWKTTKLLRCQAMREWCNDVEHPHLCSMLWDFFSPREPLSEINKTQAEKWGWSWFGWTVRLDRS